jgi:hypothetical protein
MGRATLRWRSSLAAVADIVLSCRSNSARMWCPTCQQDVPCRGTPGQEDALRCGKCQRELATREVGCVSLGETQVKSAAHASGATTIQSAASAAIPGGSLQAAPVTRLPAPTDRLTTDWSAADWELDAELRGVQRLVGSLKATASPAVLAPERASDWEVGLPRAAHATHPPTNERPATRQLAGLDHSFARPGHLRLWSRAAWLVVRCGSR